MTWLKQGDRVAGHHCELPRKRPGSYPDGQRGDVWICDTCETVWQIVDSADYPDVPRWARVLFFADRWRRIYRQMEKEKADGP